MIFPRPARVFAYTSNRLYTMLQNDSFGKLDIKIENSLNYLYQFTFTPQEVLKMLTLLQRYGL